MKQQTQPITGRIVVTHQGPSGIVAKVNGKARLFPTAKPCSVPPSSWQKGNQTMTAITRPFDEHRYPTGLNLTRALLDVRSAGLCMKVRNPTWHSNCR